MAFNEFLHQKESLVLPFQLMNHDVNVDLFPSCHTTKDGTNGTQSFTIDSDSHPLECNGRFFCEDVKNNTRRL